MDFEEKYTIPYSVIDWGIFDANDNKVDEWVSHNSLTDLGRQLLAKCWFGGDLSGLDEITKWRVGSGVNQTYGAMTELQAVNDTAKISLTNRSRAGSVDMANFAAGSGMCYGKLSEMGFYTIGGSLVSRSTMPTYTHTSGFVFAGRQRWVF
jgi:hypothetical protein